MYSLNFSRTSNFSGSFIIYHIFSGLTACYICETRYCFRNWIMKPGIIWRGTVPLLIITIHQKLVSALLLLYVPIYHKYVLPCSLVLTVSSGKKVVIVTTLPVPPANACIRLSCENISTTENSLVWATLLIFNLKSKFQSNIKSMFAKIKPT